ncbi:hypothetical protein PanWU01x14_216160 [Parasponia andersonii]|uniref:Uncharacterized protein n=1 Tax=Parasponia andersonii TaxID=3476 RepID=A0A2P5BS16_PARAD|nr:hypothetical protein PanWU01x14_216160 [Parasponia andersonii]
MTAVGKSSQIQILFGRVKKRPLTDPQDRATLMESVACPLCGLEPKIVEHLCFKCVPWLALFGSCLLGASGQGLSLTRCDFYRQNDGLSSIPMFGSETRMLLLQLLLVRTIWQSIFAYKEVVPFIKPTIAKVTKDQRLLHLHVVIERDSAQALTTLAGECLATSWSMKQWCEIVDTFSKILTFESFSNSA